MNPRSMVRSVGDTMYRQVGRVRSHVQENRPLPVDVLESDDDYRIVFDAPGAEPEDVQVRYLNGTVRIRIDRFREFREGYEMRFPGRGTTLEGDVELPDDALVEPDSGTATLTDTGTITIDIPKVSEDAVDAETDGIAIE